MSTAHGAPRITDDDIREIIEEARAHERSVLRRVLGLPVRGRVARDIDRALAERGIEVVQR